MGCLFINEFYLHVARAAIAFLAHWLCTEHSLLCSCGKNISEIYISVNLSVAEWFTERLRSLCVSTREVDLYEVCLGEYQRFDLFWVYHVIRTVQTKLFHWVLRMCCLGYNWHSENTSNKNLFTFGICYWAGLSYAILGDIFTMERDYNGRGICVTSTPYADVITSMC